MFLLLASCVEAISTSDYLENLVDKLVLLFVFSRRFLFLFIFFFSLISSQPILNILTYTGKVLKLFLDAVIVAEYHATYFLRTEMKAVNNEICN